MNARKVFVGLWLTVTLTCWAAATPLFANGTSMVVPVDSIGMTKTLTTYQASTFARLFLGPPLVPTLAATRRVEIPLQVRCTGCGATMPIA
jgi:hypothetical protein